jgi:hypothetical protein
MRTIQTFTIISLLTWAIGQSYAAPAKNSLADQVYASLSAVPAPELAPKAAALVNAAKNKDKEDTALAAIQFTTATRPGSIVQVVSALVNELPKSAASLAATAAILVPSFHPDIVQAALNAAPSQADKINKALAQAGPPATTPPPHAQNPGNRPDIPPGLVDKDPTHPGTINGNRPLTPPGHVRDPKPGRDPQRYARP